MSTRLSFIFAIMLVFIGLAALADIPRLITFQGRMLDDVGDPMDGVYLITFTIYDDSTAGKDHWTEDQNVEFIDGLFEVNLGTVATLPEDIFAGGPDLFIELAFKGVPFTPRTRLTSSAFSYHAQTVADNAILSRSIRNSAIELEDIGQNGAAKGDILVWDSSKWTVDAPANGDITAVNAGDGLSGGGTSGNVSLAIANDGVDSNKILDGSINLADLGQNGAADGQIIKWKTSAGGWVPSNLIAGDITSVAAGLGLDGGGTTGAVSLNLDTSFTDDLYVNEVGDDMTGDLRFDYGDDGVIEARIDAEDSKLQLYSGGTETIELDGGSIAPSVYLHNPAGSSRARIFGNNWGEINLYDQDQTITVSIDANESTGGTLTLDNENGTVGAELRAGNTSDGATLAMRNSAGVEKIRLDADVTGDGAAVLPDGAISAPEILDEPGIAVHVDINEVTLTASLQILDSVSITTPAEGYIVVNAHCYGETYGTMYKNWGNVRIKRAGSSGGTYTIIVFGGGDDNLDSYPSIWPVYVSRVFYLPAGTYQFQMLGAAYSDNSPGAVTKTTEHMIIAQFFPTSYGDVTVTASASEAAEFENAIPETVTRTSFDGAETTETVYHVNLRELELKATRARAAAAEAERELLEAQMQELRKAQNQNE